MKASRAPQGFARLRLNGNLKRARKLPRAANPEGKKKSQIRRLYFLASWSGSSTGRPCECACARLVHFECDVQPLFPNAQAIRSSEGTGSTFAAVLVHAARQRRGRHLAFTATAGGKFSRRCALVNPSRKSGCTSKGEQTPSFGSARALYL
jgi:hypothetical protein